jgi:predicted MFS family arabinose efflux permease
MSLGIFAGGAVGGVVASAWGASGIFVFSAALVLIWLLVAWPMKSVGATSTRA